MADYLVLARKYRSSHFDEVVGQEPISTTLTNAIQSGRIAHAFLFTGTRGVGKTSMARILAKALNCLNADAPTPRPCGQCDACRSIARGEDMDVIEIDGASNRGIDEIRELRSNAVLRPARARYKIYYIDEVHMLTKDAFNALLKTLEEPPPHVKFIFATTEAEKIPATILSRCQRFDFRNIPTADIAEHLASVCRAEGIQISEGAIFRVARAAAGSMRDGISLLDQLISSSTGPLSEQDVLRVLGTPPDERIAALMHAVADSNPAGALEQLDAILLAGFPLEGVVAALAEQFRNIMLALTCGSDSRLIELPETQRQALTELAGRFTVPAAVHALGVCEQLGRSLRGSSSARALAEAAVVRLAAAEKFVDVSSLLERLEQLSGGGPRGAAGPSRPAPAGGYTPGYAQKKNLTPAPTGNAVPAQAPRETPPAQSPAPSRPAPISRTAPAVHSASPAPSAPSAEPAAAAVEWSTPWLVRNWKALLDRVGAIPGAMSLVGALQPARPAVAAPGVLELAYDSEYEPARLRASSLGERIAEALGQLLGQTVRCEFRSSGRSAGVRPAVGGVVLGGIGTADRQKVAADPAVRAVMDMFGGQLAGVQADTEASAPATDEPAATDGPSLDEFVDADEDDE